MIHLSAFERDFMQMFGGVTRRDDRPEPHNVGVGIIDVDALMPAGPAGNFDFISANRDLSIATERLPRSAHLKTRSANCIRESECRETMISARRKSIATIGEKYLRGRVRNDRSKIAVSRDREGFR